ncbi:MAG TPA: Stk1 family PASTA domain-containing Ser/Thr kinase [Patescibacteria group bacterium]|nr:Stk1 family PASTA domain-containing Ser/Thr kinase [Patescibacteria group bacterium]
MINQTLDERYTILEKIGGGGMADVYRAHDKLLDRSVAVKVLRPQFADDEQFVISFRREAQAAAKLAHPNIVNIYDVGQEGRTYYIVMEYVCGETLKDKIEREAPLPVELAVRIATEIGEALEHAHQNNLVHCDIKPHNILMTQTGRIKVTDFGIARAVSSATMTHSGNVIGSVHYFSPEQAQGTSISAKSDIYSLGVVLYEMLSGVLPHTGETPVSVALKHLQETPRPLTEVNPSIPPLIEAIVLKAMVKNPTERYENIGQMLTDFSLAQNFLRDDHTRRLNRDDFPTQMLPKVQATQTGVLGKGQSPSPSQHPVAEKPAARSRWRIVLALFLLMMLSAVGAFLGFGKFWSLNEVTVPSVVGKQIDTARNILLNHNLRVSLSEAYSDKIPAGHVISQQPEADTMVKEQRTIMLVISKGGEITNIPDLRGLTRQDAELQIKNSGLKLGRVDEQYSPDAVADNVISQNPRPPAQVSKGTAIDIVISKGPSPRKLVLPDFQGLMISNVTSQLESLKLKAGKITEVANDRAVAGTVVGQNPPAAVEVMEGSTIDLTVAKPSGAAGKRVTVHFTVPDGSTRQNVQVVVVDTSGRRVVYEGVHKPGERLDKTVEGSGQMRVQVLINGSLLQEQLL